MKAWMDKPKGSSKPNPIPYCENCRQRHPGRCYWLDGAYQKAGYDRKNPDPAKAPNKKQRKSFVVFAREAAESWYDDPEEHDEAHYDTDGDEASK